MTVTELDLLMKKSPHEAHRAIYNEYLRYVYAIVFNKLRSCALREDIEECVSDIFSEIFLTYETDSSFSGDMKGYINTVAVRRAIDAYRRITAHNQKYHSLNDEEFKELPDNESVEESIDRNELRHIIMKKIKELGEPDTSIILLKFYYGRNSKEIGKKLSMSSMAVRKRLERALKKLKAMLSDIGIII